MEGTAQLRERALKRAIMLKKKAEEEKSRLLKKFGITASMEATALQLMVSMTLATILNLINPVATALHGLSAWIAISVTLTQENNLGSVWKKCFFRLCGTVLGGHQGLAIMYVTHWISLGSWLDPHSVAKPTTFILLVPSVCALNQIWSLKYSKYSYAFIVANVTLALVAFSGYRVRLTPQAAWFRILTIGIGVLLSAASAAVVKPVTAKAQIIAKGEKLYKTLGDLTEQVLTQYADLSASIPSGPAPAPEPAGPALAVPPRGISPSASFSSPSVHRHGHHQGLHLSAPPSEPLSRSHSQHPHHLHTSSRHGHHRKGSIADERALLLQEISVRRALETKHSARPGHSRRPTLTLDEGESRGSRILRKLGIGGGSDGRSRTLDGEGARGPGPSVFAILNTVMESARDKARGTATPPQADEPSTSLFKRGLGSLSEKIGGHLHPLGLSSSAHHDRKHSLGLGVLFSGALKLSDPKDSSACGLQVGDIGIENREPSEPMRRAKSDRPRSGPTKPPPPPPLPLQLPEEKDADLDRDSGPTSAGPVSLFTPPVSPVGSPTSRRTASFSPPLLPSFGRALSDIPEPPSLVNLASLPALPDHEGSAHGLRFPLGDGARLRDALHEFHGEAEDAFTPAQARGPELDLSASLLTPAARSIVGVAATPNTPLEEQLRGPQNTPQMTPALGEAHLPQALRLDPGLVDASDSDPRRMVHFPDPREGSGLTSLPSVPSLAKIEENQPLQGSGSALPSLADPFQHASSCVEERHVRIQVQEDAPRPTQAERPAPVSSSVPAPGPVPQPPSTPPPPTLSHDELEKRFERIAGLQAEVSLEMNAFPALLEASRHEIYLYGPREQRRARVPEKEVRDWVRLVRRVLGETISLLYPLEGGRVELHVIAPLGEILRELAKDVRALFDQSALVFSGKADPSSLVQRLESAEEKAARIFEKVTSCEGDLQFDSLSEMESLGVILSSVATLTWLCRQHFRAISGLYTVIHNPDAQLEVIGLQLREALGERDRRRDFERKEISRKSVRLRGDLGSHEGSVTSFSHAQSALGLSRGSSSHLLGQQQSRSDDPAQHHHGHHGSLDRSMNIEFARLDPAGPRG